MLTYLLKYPLSPTNISTSLLTKILSRFIKYLRFDCSDYFLRYDTEQIIGRKEETHVHSIFVKIQDKQRAHKPLQLQSFRIIQIRTIFAIFLSRLTSAKARSHAYLYVFLRTLQWVVWRGVSCIEQMREHGSLAWIIRRSEWNCKGIWYVTRMVFRRSFDTGDRETFLSFRSNCER